MVSSAVIGSGLIIHGTSDGFNRIGCCLGGIMVAEREDEEKAEEAAAGAPPPPARRTDESTSSSSITVDPTTLGEKEEAQLKEAIKKAMLDEKGQDKGYFTIGEVTSLLTMLPHTNWTESKVDRVIQEWYDKGRLMERQEIGKYTPV
jgi:hypothetical protein